jgi:hypothetical protein
VRMDERQERRRGTLRAPAMRDGDRKEAAGSCLSFSRGCREESHIFAARGIVRLYEGRKLLWERENLVVNAGLTALANLLGGVSSGEFVMAVGFGSGSTAPSAGDTALGATPTYYRAVSGVTVGPSGGVAAGSVQFTYALNATDYAANPLTIAELGLFGNTGSAIFPAAIGTTNPSWAAAHAYTVGNLIVDSNGNIQRCTTAGTSGGTAPAWASTSAATTTDNTAVWTLVAKSTAPVPMISHVVVPAFPYTGAGNFSGSWTISM